MHLTLMEADALRMLERIPPGSDLYKFKLEQYKELSTQRAEAAKLIQEHGLKKMKKQFDMRNRELDRVFDLKKFADSQRKQILSNQTRQ